MKLLFKIFSINLFLLLANCSMSLQSITDALNYSKNSADFLSYVATEKTTTDHALSYMFNKDCSLSRTLKLKQICEEIKKTNLHLISKQKNSVNKIKRNNRTKEFVKLRKKIKVPSMAY